MAGYHRTSNKTYRRNRAIVLAASTVCWLCGEPGADEVDHVVPYDRLNPYTDSVENLRPVHGRRSQQRCNQRRGNRDPSTVRASASFTW